MINVEILTPEWSRSLEADAVFLPGALGEFEVLNNHAPIISSLTVGKVKWRKGDGLETLDIKGGVVYLKNNHMRVCVEV